MFRHILLGLLLFDFTRSQGGNVFLQLNEMSSSVIFIGDWDEWSTCTRSCGDGVQTRTRSCHYGSRCDEQERICNQGECPYSTLNTPTSVPTITTLQNPTPKKTTTMKKRRTTTTTTMPMTTTTLTSTTTLKSTKRTTKKTTRRTTTKRMTTAVPKTADGNGTDTNEQAHAPPIKEKECVDNVYCSNYLAQKEVWCKYNTWIQTNCKVMCGHCPTPACTRRDHINCIDQYDEKHYYCHTRWTKQNCPQMCGNCDAPMCKAPDHPTCDMYRVRRQYYCRHWWLRQNCPSVCGLCYEEGPNWPKGEYGILSYDPCPAGWYEFNHCMDTENDNNRDDTQRVTIKLDHKCDKTSISFRYCFKGPWIPTVKGGFWAWSSYQSSAFVIRNVQGDCSKFGRDGGTIDINNEETNNQNSFGTTFDEEGRLNGQRYNEYSPFSFIYASRARTRLSFCEIGYSAEHKNERRFIEVGKFNYQKFGFFVSPASVCPIVRSPYGYMVGQKQNFFLDDENFYNRNKVVSGSPPVFVGIDSRWAICEYDPHRAIR